MLVNYVVDYVSKVTCEFFEPNIIVFLFDMMVFVTVPVVKLNYTRPSAAGCYALRN